MTATLAFPPKLVCSRRVSLESRYGMCAVDPPPRSVSLAMTVPRARRDLLMKAPSLRRSLEDAADSEPARSIKLREETRVPAAEAEASLCSDGDEGRPDVPASAARSGEDVRSRDSMVCKLGRQPSPWTR